MKKDAKLLAARLLQIRKAVGETLFEVSMAVEVAETELKEYEAGKKRPSDHMLGMLLSHYNVPDDESEEIFELAGYIETADGAILDVYKEIVVDDLNVDGVAGESREIRITVPSDTKVLYTDMVQAMTNRHGVVINFLQLAPGNNAQVVSRIGMSKDHAKSLIELLQKNIEGSES